MITIYISTAAIAEHCQGRMTTLDSKPHVLMLEHLVCSLAARRLSDMAQNHGGHKSAALLPGRRDSQPQFPNYSFFSNISQWLSLIFQPAVSLRCQLPSPGIEKPIPLLDMQHSRVILHSSATWKYLVGAMACGHYPATQEVTSLWQLLMQDSPCHTAGSWHWSISLQPSCTSVSSVAFLCF